MSNHNPLYVMLTTTQPYKSLCILKLLDLPSLLGDYVMEDNGTKFFYIMLCFFSYVVISQWCFPHIPYYYYIIIIRLKIITYI